MSGVLLSRRGGCVELFLPLFGPCKGKWVLALVVSYSLENYNSGSQPWLFIRITLERFLQLMMPGLAYPTLISEFWGMGLEGWVTLMGGLSTQPEPKRTTVLIFRAKILDLGCTLD